MNTWTIWNRVFVSLGLMLGVIFALLYVNRWWATVGQIVPSSIYENFLAVEVLKLEHGLQLYDSGLDSPNDHIFGPFPVLILYLLKLVVPSLPTSTLAHAVVMLCAVSFAGLIAKLSTLITTGSSLDPSIVKYKYAVAAGFLTFVAMPKIYFLIYHPQQFCSVLSALALACVIARLSSSTPFLYDCCLGLIAAALFLTKANYLSVYLAINFVYLFIVRGSLRSVLLFNVIFLSAVATVVLAACNPSGWFLWTIYLPVVTPRMWGTLLTGLYSTYSMALIALVVAGSLSVRFCNSKQQRGILLTFALFITVMNLMNAVKVGGTAAASSHHSIFAWIPLLIPGFQIVVSRFGYGAILAVVALGVQPYEPSATTLRSIAQSRASIAKTCVERYPGAVYLTEANWRDVLSNSNPQYALDSFIEMERAGIYNAGTKILKTLSKVKSFVVLDRLFLEHQSMNKSWIPSNQVTSFDSIGVTLNTSYQLIETISDTLHGNVSTGQVTPYAKIYRPLR